MEKTGLLVFLNTSPSIALFLVSFVMNISFSVQSKGQEVIRITDGSFENIPPFIFKRTNGWRDCGADKYPEETPPDLMDNNDKMYDDVWIQTPFGEKFVCIAVRENRSRESICQNLQHNLEKEKAYLFSIYLSNSKYFSSKSRLKEGLVDFSKPACLVVIGENEEGEFELLRTGPINHHTWKKYTLLIQPQKDFHTIILEADFEDEIFTYNGHLFLDNISDLEEVNAAEYDKISIE